VTQLELEPDAKKGGRRRKTRVIKHTGVVICAALVICVSVLFAVRLSHSSSEASASAQAPIRYLGVFEPGSPGSYAGVEKFAQVVGRKPNLVVYYSVWNEKFQEAFAEDVVSHGATPIIQIEPFGVSLAKIAAGTYDSYLSSFADDVAAFGYRVIISFGHEMNGYWYSWGYGRTSPTVFIAAWRHIVTLFREHGADNVTWLWQVNSLSSQTSPPGEWWPGSQYVSWVGVSGYYYLPGDSFAYIFDPIFVDIRQFTQDPVLIAETAVGPQAGQSRGIRDLFAGLRAQGDIGLVWFDQHSYGGTYKGEDWRLEDSQSALNAFRAGLRGANAHK
jgi:mannan endo-1,4-beta-mannosidase